MYFLIFSFIQKCNIYSSIHQGSVSSNVFHVSDDIWIVFLQVGGNPPYYSHFFLLSGSFSTPQFNVLYFISLII